MQRDLVLRAQTGDHDAFNALILAAVDRLHRTARLILRDQERASDAVQDALIAAWRDIRAVRDPDRFDAWLHRLLVNACFRAANRERRRSVMEVHVAEIDAPMPRSDHEDLIVRDELERAFRRLTIEQRAVLVLHHYLDLPDAAAAETLGVPVGTFKFRLPTWTPDGARIIFTKVVGTGFGNPTMMTILPDGTGMASATATGEIFGTHPRLRPVR